MALLLNELIKSEEYFLNKIQHELYWSINNYLKTNDITRSVLAERLGVSKGYISQVLNNGFDHKLSKLIELSLAVGKAPVLEFIDLDTYKENIYHKGAPISTWIVNEAKRDQACFHVDKKKQLIDQLEISDHEQNSSSHESKYAIQGKIRA